MKKLLRIPLLLAAMFLTTVPLSAHAFEVDGIYYKFIGNGIVEVTYSGNYASQKNEYTGSVVIPDSVTYNDYTYSVSKIGDEAFAYSSIHSITIPKSVTEIGNEPFAGCNNLFLITVDDGNAVYDSRNNCNAIIETTSNKLIQGCRKTTIPNSIIEIGGAAFSNYTWLTSFEIPNSVKIISDDAFWDCTELNSVTIPNSVTTITGSAFGCCSSLTSITIPSSVTTIGGFRNTGLTSIDIPDSVTSIDNLAFCQCTSLSSVTIPNSVTTIGDRAFSGCIGLTSVTIGDSVTTIGGSAFSGCTGLTSVTIGDSVTTIGGSAFSGCTGLTSVTIGDSVTTIGGNAFYGCTGLTEVLISSIESWLKIEMAPGVFHSGYKLILNGTEVTNLTIPTSISQIKSYAFYGCIGLTSVTIPNSVTTIGECAFRGCTGLTELIIPNSVVSLGENVFDGKIIIEEGNPKYFTHEDVTYWIDSNTGKIYVHTYPNYLTEYIVPTFLNTKFKIPDIKSVIISEDSKLTEVEIRSGRYSKLENLEIREPLDTITLSGGDNLSEAVNLKKLILPKKIKVGKYGGTIKLYKTTKEKESEYLSTYKITYNLHPMEILQLPSLNLIGFVCTYGYSGDYSYIVENGTSYGSYTTGTNSKYSLLLPASLKTLTLTDQSDFMYNANNNTWYSFNNTCENDCDIEILKPVTNFENTTFQNSAISKITMGATEIPTELFAGCANLKSLTLPFAGAGTAQTVGNFGELFGTTKNDNMRAVTQLMESGTSKTYYLPTGLKELVIGEGCEQLPYGALYNCSMIEKLTLPTTIKGVKENALYGCDGLTDIYVKRALPPSAYETSFTGVNQFGCTLHVPHNSKQYYSIANGWKYFYFIEEEAPLTVSVAKSIENAGEILGINQYDPGATAEMEAIAHSGYTFVGWYEDGQLLTTDSKYSFTVTESHTLVAQFASLLNENDVTVTPQSEAVTLSWEQEGGWRTVIRHRDVLR